MPVLYEGKVVAHCCWKQEPTHPGVLEKNTLTFSVHKNPFLILFLFILLQNLK
jgi:hypothetical protein